MIKRVISTTTIAALLVLTTAVGLTATAPVAHAATCTGSVGPGIPPPRDLTFGQDGFHAAWFGQSGYPTLCPGGTSSAVVAFYNTGSRGWVLGRAGETAYLGTNGPEPGQDRPSLIGGDGTNGSPATGWPRFNRVAVQPASYVGPGQVAWFQFTVKAPMESGTYRLALRPLIEGTTWMEDVGVFWYVTVLQPDGSLPIVRAPAPPSFVEIRIGADVTEADGLQDIRDGLGRAQAYYEKVAGPNPLTSLLVIVHRKEAASDPDGQVCCPARPGMSPPEIELKVNYQEWIKSRDTRMATTYSRQYVIAHEVWHVWQNKLGCPSHDYRRPLWPVWMTEGGAEFMQWQVMLGSALVTPAQLLSFERQMASENARLGAGTLLSLESGEYSNRGFYAKGYFGTKRLVERSGVVGLRMFCNEMGAGAAWPAAFARAFGIEPAAFYAEFEAWYSVTYPAAVGRP